MKMVTEILKKHVQVIFTYLTRGRDSVSEVGGLGDHEVGGYYKTQLTF